tara:strand:+ start:2498 stop:3568 length:1071 start_codon:yes stop_codon:yes gene_type:complete
MRINLFLSFVLLFSCVSVENKDSKNSNLNQDPMIIISSQIDNDITNDALYVKRAKINIEKSRYKEALKDLNLAHSLDTTKGETHFLLGNVLLELAKRGSGSEESLKKASKHFYTSVKYGYNLSLSYKNAGEIFMHRGMVDKTNIELLNTSIQLLEESIRIDPTNSHTFILLGYAYLEREGLEKAINCFNKSIELDSNNEEAFLQLGNLYLSMQDSLSIKFYKEVLDINSENRLAWYNLGLSYHMNGDLSKSQDAYHKIIEFGVKDQSYINANYNLAKMFMEDLKDYKNALNNYLVEIIRVNPNHVLALFRMGICYQSLGDVRNAEEYYRRTLQISPDFEEANTRLEKLLSDNEKYN